MPVPQDSVAAAVLACRAAEDKKATDLAILEVADVLTLVDLFVLATARNDRQLKAVVEAVERRLIEELGRRPLRVEGTPMSGWVLLDYGDVVCHLFDTEQREYYALERLWSDVPRRDPATGELLAAEPAAADL